MKIQLERLAVGYLVVIWTNSVSQLLTNIGFSIALSELGHLG